MRSLFILTFVFLVLGDLQAGKTKYPVRNIPEELKTAARAVVRLDDQRVEMNPGGSIEHKHLYAITILEENAEEMATFYGPYDKYLKLRNISGRIYNAQGEQVEVLRSEDVLDMSTMGSYSLYEDSRVKILDPDYNQYPYTVEFTYTYVYKTLLYLPDWWIYEDYNVAVQKGVFQIKADSENSFRYLAVNMDLEPYRTKVQGGEVYLWSVENMPALVDESVSRNLEDISPVVYLAPNGFNYGSTQGSFRSWKEFGEWIHQLGKDKREIPIEEKEVIFRLVEGLEDDHEKTSVLYKYMQDKVRYVYLELGAGGLEPIPARKVSEEGYGDCKALSNYMLALLDVVGIESYYTVVMAGMKPQKFISDFPSLQFNHVILAVPFEKDTMWLECTNQRLPAGYLGVFTDDRPVLLVTREGGVLSRTPKYEAEENRQTMNTICLLHQDLSASVSSSREYGGVNYGNMLSFIYEKDQEEQKRAIQKRSKLNAFELDHLSFDVETDSEPLVTENVSLSVYQFLSDEGEYLPLALNVLSDDLGLPARSRNRKYPVYIKRGLLQDDSVTFMLPEQLEIHHLPEPITIQTDFGSYEATATAIEGGIVYHRRLLLREGEYEPSRFREFYGFLRKVNSADNRKALLTRQTD